ncbi:hypothetical protein ASE04_29590 [Rhizobium sp. Root708]|uniref:TIGR02588 family protein n=1 Tax=Rhizobium sp. Root708 TaxID=1736592 RepID=UPI0006F838D8|nr:TIGR02588 family protein [Rhizobium sp. Root708]KRB53446.1 hypothetical protein ASE04_29590 [Rhizobium sp. Root708]
MTKTSGDTNIEVADPHWIEWVTGLISAIIVVAVILWIGKDAVTDLDTSPDLTGNVLHVDQRSSGYQVQFEISNSASATASQVTVQGLVRDATTVVETADTVVDYVPGHSKATGGLIFQHDPRGKGVEISAAAYNDP